MKSILILALTFFLFSCSYSHTSGGADPKAPISFVDGQEPVVRFADVNAAVFVPKCAQCHQKRGLKLTFADYANTIEFGDDIEFRTFEDSVDPMPPKQDLTELQLQVLKTWLDSGSPE
jgi:hypothetical protein